MLRTSCFLLVLTGLLLGVLWLPARSAPPLVVDKKSPLLLSEEPKKAAAKPAQAGADNEACFVCHGDYREETLAGVHAKEKIGCMKCHGASAAHRADEDNITPPEIMYPAAKIDAACRACHSEHNVPASKVIATWQQRCPGKKAEQLVCTDCHGTHRRPFRVVQWDKQTGKLLATKPKK
jgi:formate-dependent nitrite reductase cytochrome c552 subunit